jgi:hypothetical protein
MLPSELHAAFLLLAACVLVVQAAGWCLAAQQQATSSTGAPVLAFSALRASIWGLHIEAPYKKQQLKKAMPSALFMEGRPPASFA